MFPTGADLPATREDLRRELHVWIARPDELRDEAVLLRYRSWLSDEERARADRYLRAGDRHLFLVAHALLRSTLSRYGGLRPEEWQFETGQHGRPRLAGDPPTCVSPRRLGFSLSHTRGLVACLVSDEIDCGVDVERLGSVEDPMALASRYFSATERDDLGRTPDGAAGVRFLEYWTLKEAWLKACGLGLELPLDRFRFTLGRDGEISVAFESPIEDRSQDWQFARCRPLPEHVLAIAVRRSGRSDRAIVMREMRSTPA